MITYEEFQDCCNSFLEKGKTIKNFPIWKKVSDANNDYEYLINLTNVSNKTDSSKSNIHLGEKYLDFNDVLESLEVAMDDDEKSVTNLHSSYWKLECHIVYSLAYCVPVLYFNAWNINGKSVDHDKIWDCVVSKAANVTHKWESVSQGHHPILGIPFYFFHPCRTSDVMEISKTNPLKWKEVYIAAWLEVYGSVLGLNIPLEYFVLAK